MRVLVAIVGCSLYWFSDKLACHWWSSYSVLVCLDHQNTNIQHRPYTERLHKYHPNGISAQISYGMTIDALLHMYESPDTLCSNNMLNIISKRFKLILMWVRHELILKKKIMYEWVDYFLLKNEWNTFAWSTMFQIHLVPVALCSHQMASCWICLAVGTTNSSCFRLITFDCLCCTIEFQHLQEKRRSKHNFISVES